MTLKTKSAFIYGHTFDDTNQYLDFSEDGITELTAIIEDGSYSISEVADIVAQALNDVGDNTYTVTLDRVTRKFTISADGNFDLYVTTGSNVATSAYALLGFLIDKSGSNSYESDGASGSIYRPQAKLYNYVDFNDIEEAANAVVNISTDGSEVETVSFGQVNFMECNIRYVTDITGQGYLDDNPNAVSELRIFMQYITKKRPIEFIPDRDDLEVYTKCFLERTQKSSQGTAFELKELYSQGLAFYFESGLLVFRRLD